MTIVPRHVVRSSTVGRQPIETLRGESAWGNARCHGPFRPAAPIARAKNSPRSAAEKLHEGAQRL